MTATLSISDNLKYVQLQMAAEAFIRDPDTLALSASGDDLIRALIKGNKHTLLFTQAQAKDFAAQWEVLDQRANTSTGFSGTLFKNRATGELVMSFRSTEFIDDAARDNQATNSMELASYGFAFGQIRDMEDWYAQLTAPGGKLEGTGQFAVTGYSLGGHLATVFNWLHRNEGRVGQVVTFNGAGVGGIDPNTTLAQVVADFKRLSVNASGHEFTFSDANLAQLYARARQDVNGGGSISAQDKQTLTNYINAPAEGSDIVDTQTRQQALMIWNAAQRIDTIRAEVARVKTMSSGGTPNTQPEDVVDSRVGQENLDYQMAVLTVQDKTGAASLVGGALRMLPGGKRYGGRFDNQVDVVGATSPSAVANSQWHFGSDAQVFIEDQPVYRGGVISAAIAESFRNFGIKLLVDGYATKDFGDTHSLGKV